MSKPTLEELVAEWLRLDKEEGTLDEIARLWKEKKVQDLEDRLRQRIEFGTADEHCNNSRIGLKAYFHNPDTAPRPYGGWFFSHEQSHRHSSLTTPLEVLNCRVSYICPTTKGLAAYVLEMVSDAKAKGVVIGHDHRHNSDHWASLTAAAFLNFGINVYLHRGLVHTPLVPFSVSALGTACGVMITASHNPKDDNGYKVYWQNAVQIIDPHDKGIATAIKENLEPRTWDIQAITSSPLLHDKTKEMQEAYFSYLQTLSHSKTHNSSTTVQFVNTSMHGVGHSYAIRAFTMFGLPPFTPVERQQDPDPNFSTVKSPNPEEKGALDLALADADRIQADYILAQDPDADRFSAAERGEDGKWTIFSGDMLGSIFAARIFEVYIASGKPLNKLAMVASTVSSKMVESMARMEGFKFAECLTGFKHIGNTSLDLVREGYEVPFAYEEAIGFMIGSKIRDKDGIAATVFFAELAAELNRRGLKVSQYLSQLYSRYGYFQTSNGYFICRSTSTIERIFTRLRDYHSDAHQRNYPREIGGLHIVSVCDLTTGYDSSNPPTYKPLLPLSFGHMIQFRAESDSATEAITLTIRTSGTEPKIKYYLEGSGHNIDSVRATLERVGKELATEWVQAAENGLEMP